MFSGSLSFFYMTIMNIDLDYLDFSHNLLSGLLDLGDNKLTGIIPPWIGERLDGLIVLRLRSNEFHDNIPSTLCRLLFLQVLDLSLNNISRAILSCLNKLTAMASAASFEAMTYLWEGSFGNMLRESIFKEIGQLKSLDSLDLSTNNLSGNPRLCGESLCKCPEDEPPKVPNNGNIERSNKSDEGLFELMWFFNVVVRNIHNGEISLPSKPTQKLWTKLT
ncbi:hypothetical protein GOBAR_AA06018 [Gossypium barbadense]|uniref:Leucine-rich repeat-containing N-terminal plant-type domain-containing protein n=1 Tax=Gossypium barbadense TaxID=3634 RepID=A0A2P5YG36_GOSBA|nr:hypothetical protein GOBAR_AA06018 [Gossypium barbadense]